MPTLPTSPQLFKREARKPCQPMATPTPSDISEGAVPPSKIPFPTPPEGVRLLIRVSFLAKNILFWRELACGKTLYVGPVFGLINNSHHRAVSGQRVGKGEACNECE